MKNNKGSKDISKKKATRQPIQKFRLGSISISAWENTSKNGNTFLNFNIQKRYFDGKDWIDTASLNVQDMSVIKALCEKASDFAMTYESKSKGKKSDEEDSEDEDEDEDDEEDEN